MTAGDEVLVEVESVGKKYCRSLRRSLMYLGQDLAKEISGNEPARGVLRRDEFWALHDVSFSVHRGECLSVIGGNGAGKSTLLKLLSGVQRPDAGRIRIRGRVGSLIELGAGFHPLLTGRENIRLLASLYGLTDNEIESRFDWIVSFSGLEASLDMPVRSYSSGMVAKLAFSIAASVEPDVLLVDEVLSVGDIAFRSRCMARIADMMRQGTSILFVSHQMALIDKISDRVLYLQPGQEPLVGPPSEVIDTFRKAMAMQGSGQERVDHEDLRIVSVEIGSPEGEAIEPGGSLVIEARYVARVALDVYLNIAFHKGYGDQIAACRTDRDGFGLVRLKRGEGQFRMQVKSLPLAPGHYSISIRVIGQTGFDVMVDHQAQYPFVVVGGADVEGVVELPHQWVIADDR